MLTTQVLVERARGLGRISSDARARRWLRAVACLLADWGGPQAAAVLREALPAELLRGPGSRGRTFKEALRVAGDGGEQVALHEEAGRRTREPDPGKVAMTLRPLAGLLLEQLAPAQRHRVAAGLPPVVASWLSTASPRAPWTYRLIPQSYARPAAEGHGHH